MPGGPRERSERAKIAAKSLRGAFERASDALRTRKVRPKAPSDEKSASEARPRARKPRPKLARGARARNAHSVISLWIHTQTYIYLKGYFDSSIRDLVRVGWPCWPSQARQGLPESLVGDDWARPGVPKVSQGVPKASQGVPKASPGVPKGSPGVPNGSPRRSQRLPQGVH